MALTVRTAALSLYCRSSALHEWQHHSHVCLWPASQLCLSADAPHAWLQVAREQEEAARRTEEARRREVERLQREIAEQVRSATPVTALCRPASDKCHPLADGHRMLLVSSAPL
jgi:hypothetical protein